MDRAVPHLLLLAGAGEARDVALALANRPEIRVTASLLHPPRAFGPLPVPTRLGGFGGADRFCSFLRTQGVTGVLDATHPFASRIGTRSAALCAKEGVPYARRLRPAWAPQPGDGWTFASDEADACAHIGFDARVFTTTGRATLDGFCTFPGARLFVRRLIVDPAPPPWSFVTWVPGAGPFSVADETATFRRLGIDHLIVKDAGGQSSRTKLDAARALGLPVILLRRPRPPDALCLDNVPAALQWVSAL